MRIRILYLLIFMFIPSLVHANSSGEGIYYALILAFIVGPYWLFSLLPFMIQWRNRGRSLFFSLLAYILCICGISLAKYQGYGNGMPGFNLEEDLIFYLMCLPFIVIIILTARKDWLCRKY